MAEKKDKIKLFAKGLVFFFISVVIVILLVEFVRVGIDWLGFVEFVISCLLLIFLIEKIAIKVPGLFEIKDELKGVKKGLENLVIAFSKSEANATAKSEIHEHYHYDSVPHEALKSDAPEEALKIKNNL